MEAPGLGSVEVSHVGAGTARARVARAPFLVRFFSTATHDVGDVDDTDGAANQAICVSDMAIIRATTERFIAGQ